MSNWQKWASRPAYDQASERLVCVLMVSRNKDNRDVPGFAQRRRSFIMGVPKGESAKSMLVDDFLSFADAGVPGEMSRLYVSVNARDNAKVRKLLLERLIFDDSVSMGRLPSLICGLAADHACAAEHKWLFDVDPEHGHEDRGLAYAFAAEVADAIGCDASMIPVRTTPNGYAVIAPHGFDTRELMARWPIVTLKRDDLLCIDWERTAADAGLEAGDVG